MNQYPPTPPRAAFAATEVLIIVSILVILGLIFFWPRSRDQKSRQTVCINNQRQIILAVTIYAQDHGELLPKADAVWQSIKLDSNTLVCPTAGKKLSNGYVYNHAVAGNSLYQFANPPVVMVTCDGISSPGSLPNVCFGDGNIARRHAPNIAFASFMDGHVEPIQTADPVWFKPEIMKRKEHRETIYEAPPS